MVKTKSFLAFLWVFLISFFWGSLLCGDFAWAADAAVKEFEETSRAEAEKNYNEMKEPSIDADSSSPTSPGSKLSTTDFKFNPRDISPSRKVYAKGNTESSNNGNVKDFLYRLSQVLLVVVSTGAVLFITIGGFLMATSAGDSEKANKGKIIVTYNIIALAVAMLSYGIIQFVIWILWTAS